MSSSIYPFSIKDSIYSSTLFILLSLLNAAAANAVLEQAKVNVRLYEDNDTYTRDELSIEWYDSSTGISQKAFFHLLKDTKHDQETFDSIMDKIADSILQ